MLEGIITLAQREQCSKICSVFGVMVTVETYSSFVLWRRIAASHIPSSGSPSRISFQVLQNFVGVSSLLAVERM